jgi:hypothetical protein
MRRDTSNANRSEDPRPVLPGQPGTHEFIDEFALAYHRAVAKKLRVEPEKTLLHAKQTLERWIASGSFDGGELRTLDEWRKLLEESDVQQLIDLITEVSDEGQRLRSSSPFAGALPQSMRREILTNCEKRSST